MKYFDVCFLYKSAFHMLFDKIETISYIEFNENTRLYQIISA